MKGKKKQRSRNSALGTLFVLFLLLFFSCEIHPHNSASLFCLIFLNDPPDCSDTCRFCFFFPLLFCAPRYLNGSHVLQLGGVSENVSYEYPQLQHKHFAGCIRNLLVDSKVPLGSHAHMLAPGRGTVVRAARVLRSRETMRPPFQGRSEKNRREADATRLSRLFSSGPSSFTMLKNPLSARASVDLPLAQLVPPFHLRFTQDHRGERGQRPRKYLTSWAPLCRFLQREASQPSLGPRPRWNKRGEALLRPCRRFLFTFNGFKQWEEAARTTNNSSQAKGRELA